MFMPASGKECRYVTTLLDAIQGFPRFHQVDMLMEGLTSLSPRGLTRILKKCRSIKYSGNCQTLIYNNYTIS